MSLQKIQGACATLRHHYRWHWKRKCRMRLSVAVRCEWMWRMIIVIDIQSITRMTLYEFTVTPPLGHQSRTKMISFQLCITESASLFIVVLSIEQVFFGAQNFDFTWKFDWLYWIGPFCWIESEEQNDELPRNLVEWCWIVFEMLE